MSGAPVNKHANDPIPLALGFARAAVRAGDPLPLLLLLTRRERAEVAATAGLPTTDDPLALAAALRPLLVEGAEAPQDLAPLLAALRVRKLHALGDRAPVGHGFVRPAPRRGTWIGRLLGRGTNLLDEAIGALPGLESRMHGMLRANVLLAGRSGSGKSTLVNAVFGRVVAEAGEGAPVTRGVTWYRHPVAPLRLGDTRGLEPGAYKATRTELEAELTRLADSADPEERLHLAWLCVDAAAERVEPADRDLAALLAEHGVPVIVVLTKAWAEDRLSAPVRTVIPDARAVIPVVAAPRLFAGGARVEARGLEDLVEATIAALPEGRRAAAAAANLVALGPRIAEAEALIERYAALAAGTAAIPVPLADAAALVATQAKMIVDLTVAMGTPADELPTETVVAALVGSLTAGLGGRLAARGLGPLLKFIPGLGTVAGTVVSAGVAYGTTRALGAAYLALVKDRWAVLSRPPTLGEVVEFLGRFRPGW